MKASDLFAMCVRNLIRRKYRTLLTLIGVVAGTCAVVLMISIGLGMKQSQAEQLAQMGDLTVIEVYNYGKTDDKGNKIVIDDAAMEKIKALPGVAAATPLYNPSNLNATIFAGQNDRYSMAMYNVVGVYPEALEAMGYELTEGTWENAFSEPFSMVIGQYASYNLVDSRKKTGKNQVDPYPDRQGKISDPFLNLNETKLTLRITNNTEGAKKIEFKPTVSAVMMEDWQRGYETSRGIFMSVSDVKRLESEYIKANKIKVNSRDNAGYTNVKVKATDISMVESIEKVLSEELQYDTWSMESIRKPMEEQTKQIQMFLGMIAGVSLFVAALGIINTMLMSVYERTREIGVMKVVGCSVKDIRSLFLIEAGFIGLIGGIIGVCLSMLIAYCVNYLGLNISFGSNIFGNAGGGQMFIITPWLVGMALLFSTIIGITSGYYPANRAVKISALTAIKQE